MPFVQAARATAGTTHRIRSIKAVRPRCRRSRLADIESDHESGGTGEDAEGVWSLMTMKL